jgi:heterodisulfide reductase subunit C
LLHLLGWSKTKPIYGFATPRQSNPSPRVTNFHLGVFNTDKGRKDLVNVSEINETFCRQVLAKPGGDRFRACFQCGTCTASCPVRAVESRYNPRVLVKMVELGLRERVLGSDILWLCSLCYQCQERCPEDVRFPELMTVLRNMAVEAGYIHPSFAKLASIVAEQGRIYEVDDFINMRRKQLGLPVVPTDRDEWGKLSQLLRFGK